MPEPTKPETQSARTFGDVESAKKEEDKFTPQDWKPLGSVQAQLAATRQATEGNPLVGEDQAFKDAVAEWKSRVFWRDQAKAEKDLLLSRVLADIFRPRSGDFRFVIRGSAALHKLYISPERRRFCERLNLAQLGKASVEQTLEHIEKAMEFIPGKVTRKNNPGWIDLSKDWYSAQNPAHRFMTRVTLDLEGPFCLLDPEFRDWEMSTSWFQGRASIEALRLEELLGIRLLALYRRGHGKDLYDLWAALEEERQPDVARTVEALKGYARSAGVKVNRAAFEKTLAAHLRSMRSYQDLFPLLPLDSPYNPVLAANKVRETFFELI